MNIHKVKTHMCCKAISLRKSNNSWGLTLKNVICDLAWALLGERGAQSHRSKTKTHLGIDGGRPGKGMLASSLGETEFTSNNLHGRGPFMRVKKVFMNRVRII